MKLISIKLFWPKSEIYFNKIDVLCLFNYIILKIVQPEQYIKRLIGKKSKVWLYVYILKNKIFFCTL